MNCGDFPQPGHQLVAFDIMNSSALDIECQVPLAVHALHPTVTITVMVEVIGPCGFQLPAQPVLKLTGEPF
ncbi:hypothetical protein D3C71_1950220 [compost metagenome]